MEITKAEILKELSTPSIDASDTRSKVESVSESDWIESPNELEPKIQLNKYKWNISYFNQQVGAVNRLSFSKKRFLHALDVKQYLQELGAEGFDIEESEESDVSTPNFIHNDTINATNEIKHNENSGEELKSLREDEKLSNSYFPDRQLLTAVEGKSVVETQVALEMALNDSRLNSVELRQSILYVKKNLPKVFEQYQVSNVAPAFNENKEFWDKDYFFLQKAYLNFNFSLERFEHLIEVRGYLKAHGDQLSKNSNISKKLNLAEDDVKIDSKEYDIKSNGNYNNVTSKEISDLDHFSNQNTISRASAERGFYDYTNHKLNNFKKLFLILGSSLLALIIFIWLLTK